MTPCAVCQKPITYRFSICRDCEALYGRRAKEWPPWVREMVNSDRRERRQEQNMGRYEMTLVTFQKKSKTTGTGR